MNIGSICGNDKIHARMILVICLSIVALRTMGCVLCLLLFHRFKGVFVCWGWFIFVGFFGYLEIHLSDRGTLVTVSAVLTCFWIASEGSTVDS